MRYVIVLFFTMSVLWSEDGLYVGGWVRSGIGTAAFVHTHGMSNALYIGQTTWRLSVHNLDTEYARFEALADVSILSGVMTNILTSSMNWRIAEESLLTVDIRKFSVMVKPFWGDIILGRQFIRWGEGVIFSPMDFFTRLDQTDVALSRVGVDALRVKLPLGQLGFMESIGMIHSSWTNSTAGIRFGGGISSWYGTLAAFYRGKEKEWLGGFSLKGDLGPSWYGEAVYHFSTNTNRVFWHAMVGMDYSLQGKLVFRLEYVTHTLEKTNFTLFEQYGLLIYPFLDNHYASLQLIYIPTIIDNISLTFVGNLDDPEEILWEKGQWWIVSYSRNLYQNVNLMMWFRYQTDISRLFTPREGIFSCMVSLEVRY